MKLRHWWADRDGNKFRKGGQDYLDVSGVNGLWQLLQGTDTNHPSFEGFWDSHACSPRVKAGIYHAIAVASRSPIIWTSPSAGPSKVERDVQAVRRGPGPAEEPGGGSLR